MINIRCDMFETNSSSCHSITICQTNDYKKWVNGELYFHNSAASDNHPFLTLDEVVQYVKDSYYKGNPEFVDLVLTAVEENNQERLIELLKSANVFTVESYRDSDDDLEYYSRSYTTPGGEQITAFGCYGSRY